MIYLLEDDESIRKLVIYALESQGFSVSGFGYPSEFYRALRERLPALLILDVMLPEEDGIQILKKLRRDASTKSLPVIMLTARSEEFDRVEGLDAGADDYLSKPFGMMELIARVRALLRRTERKTAPAELKNGPISFSEERHEVLVDGMPISLTAKEFSLLLQLLKNKGLVLSREQLLHRIWGIAAEYENRTLDVHIRTLRSKLRDAGALIETVRGVGYRMKEAENDR